jgi:hypothetical protein
MCDIVKDLINEREYRMSYEDNIRNQFHLSPDVGFGDLARYLDHWMKKCKEKEENLRLIKNEMLELHCQNRHDRNDYTQMIDCAKIQRILDLCE